MTFNETVREEARPNHPSSSLEIRDPRSKQAREKSLFRASKNNGIEMTMLASSKD